MTSANTVESADRVWVSNPSRTFAVPLPETGWNAGFQDLAASETGGIELLHAATFEDALGASMWIDIWDNPQGLDVPPNT